MSALRWSVAITWTAALAFWPARVGPARAHSWLAFITFGFRSLR
jgi:hypothetical protein